MGAGTAGQRGSALSPTPHMMRSAPAAATAAAGLSPAEDAVLMSAGSLARALQAPVMPAVQEALASSEADRLAGLLRLVEGPSPEGALGSGESSRVGGADPGVVTAVIGARLAGVEAAADVAAALAADIAALGPPDSS